MAASNKDKEGFFFFKSFYEAIQCLDDADRLAIYEAVISYGLYGEEAEDLEPIQKGFFIAFRPNIDARKAAQENGAQGGRSKAEHARRRAAQKEKAAKEHTTTPAASDAQTAVSSISDEPQEKPDAPMSRMSGTVEEEIGTEVNGACRGVETDVYPPTEFSSTNKNKNKNKNKTKKQEQEQEQGMVQEGTPVPPSAPDGAVPPDGGSDLDRVQVHEQQELFETQETKADVPKKTKVRGELTGHALELFERWYVEFPKKVSRGAAERAWRRINPDDELTEKMIRAVQAQRTKDHRFRDGYVPNPSTWLNGKEWENVYNNTVPSPETQRRLQNDDRTDWDAWAADNPEYFQMGEQPGIV